VRRAVRDSGWCFAHGDGSLVEDSDALHLFVGRRGASGRGVSKRGTEPEVPAEDLEEAVSGLPSQELASQALYEWSGSTNPRGTTFEIRLGSASLTQSEMVDSRCRGRTSRLFATTGIGRSDKSAERVPLRAQRRAAGVREAALVTRSLLERVTSSERGVEARP
jgi:hypothetical protein